MARKTVIVSDLSGKMADGGEAIKVVVLEHPELGGTAVELDLVDPEPSVLAERAKDFVLLEVHSGRESYRYALEVGDFDSLATDRPMADVLRDAPRVQAAEPTRRRGGPRKETAAAPQRAATRDFDIAALRAWAASNNIDVPQRGRIPQSIVDQYKAAGN